MTPFNSKVAKATGHRLALCGRHRVRPSSPRPPVRSSTKRFKRKRKSTSRRRSRKNQINEIRERTQDAAGRYAQAMADAESLERYNNQLNEQVKSQQTEIASIERQLLDIETTNREVQPLMEQMVDTLEQFVKLDVPFFLDERTTRVESLKDMMTRADVTISEKYRRILEAYQIELEYGRTLDAYEGRLGTGADARTVEFVRLGRVSLMYRTLDGAETGYWDASKKTGSWTTATAKPSRKRCASRAKTAPPIC